MNLRKPTLDQIAQMANVSKSTVSLALSNKGRISPQVREQIMQIANDLNYNPRPRSTGKHGKHSAGMSGEIALLLNKDYIAPTNPHSMLTLAALQDQTQRDGYSLAIYALSSEETQNRILPACLTNNVKGLVVDGSLDHDYVVEVLRGRRPLVLIGYGYMDTGLDCVHSNELMGGKSAVDYLISMGHRRIGLIWGLKWHSSNYRRKLGYLMALEQTGLEVDPRIISPALTDNTMKAGYTATIDIIRKTQTKAPLDAIFCINDTYAAGCLSALADLGLRVPQDISVMGYDNLSFSSQLMPPLTTMHFPTDHVARWAVRRLSQLIDSQARGYDDEAVEITIPPALIKRESVREITI